MVRWLSIHLDLEVHLGCFRAIMYDPEIYPDPQEFKPERFLDKDGSFRDDPTITLAFGAGKRICPGRHFVDATLFIVAASVLSVFDVTKAKDENGQEIPVKVAMTVRSGIVVYVSGYRSYVLLGTETLILKTPGRISVLYFSKR
jgi:cytochrome P450